MIVTELWEGGWEITPIAHLVEWQGSESLKGLGTVCILMNVPIRSDHGVMGGKGKRSIGPKEGDGTAMAAIE
jgi:hypothetical protein